MAIKAAIGKLDADIPRIAAEIPANGFRTLAKLPLASRPRPPGQPGGIRRD
jgi:hypothetical protein